MMSALDLRVDAQRHMPTLPDVPYLVTGARRTWFGRMVNEYGSARVFEAPAAQLAVAEVPEGEAFPAHDDVPPLEAPLRNRLSISCLSETVAVALRRGHRGHRPRAGSAGNSGKASVE
jgi:hypothetical protein